MRGDSLIMSLLTWVITVLLSPFSLCAALINGCIRAWRKEPHILERLGIWGRTPKRVVWLHGASVGECLSLKLLLASLQKQSPIPVLLTTTTSTARAIMEKFHPLVRHQVWDVWPFVALRLYLTRPTVWVAVESEIWPVWIWTLRRMNVPVMLLNARMSKRSMAKWQRFPWLARSIFKGIHYATTNTPERAQFLVSMGVHHVEHQSHLKYLSEPLPVNQTSKDAYQHAIKERPVWMAASVHFKEHSTIIQAMKQSPQALTILAPRHIHTVDAWCDQLSKHGFKGVRHSQFQGSISANTDYIIVDSMGDLPIFYSLSPIVLVGGNLAPGMGGHNIMEPGTFGCAVIWGPYVDSCQDVCHDLAAYGYPLKKVSDLSSTLHHLLNHPDEAKQKGILMQENLALQRQALEVWSQAWVSRICRMSDRKSSEKEASA